MNLQPVEVSKIFVSLALAKYLSQPEIDFRKQRSQLIAAALVFTPAILSVMQGETGLALVYFSFLIPMYREGLPAGYLIVGAAMGGVLLVISLLYPAKTLIIAFTIITACVIYLLRRLINKNRQLLTLIISIWLFCSFVCRSCGSFYLQTYF
ncbi:MAG: FtsW/RodA/SpoVE family cell cycle protein [Ferruginibacter sp.]